MNKILDVVRGINAITNGYKHKMYNTDERFVRVAYACLDSSVQFDENETSKIYKTVISVCKEFERSETGRPKPMDVFYKCYIGDEGKAVWNIFKNGMVVLTLEFNTDTLLPEYHHRHVHRELLMPMDFNVIRTPVVKVSDSDAGSWIGRIHKGSSIILKRDMDDVHTLLERFVCGKLNNTDGLIDFNMLFFSMAPDWKLCKNPVINGTDMTSVDIYFRGTISNEPTYTWSPYPVNTWGNAHEFSMTLQEQNDELKKWIKDYCATPDFEISLY